MSEPDYSARAKKAWDTRGRTSQGGGSGAVQGSGDYVRALQGSATFVGSNGATYDPDSGLDTEHAFAKEIVGPDGKTKVVYDPKRIKEVHEPIVARALEGVPRSANPTVYFLGGGPASGKSSIQKLGPSSGVEMPEKGMSALSNPDECRVLLPEWQEVKAKYPEKSALMTHEEASKISKDILTAALANGQDVTLDTAGDNGYESIKKKTDQIRKAGHRIVANYATLPTAEAYRRSYLRATSPTNPDGTPNSDYGRFCAKSYLTQMHANISRDFEKCAPLFDDVKLWSGPGYPGLKGGRPALIASGGRNRPFVIHNAKLYQEFLAKAKLKPNDIPSIHSAGGALTNPRY